MRAKGLGYRRTIVSRERATSRPAKTVRNWMIERLSTGPLSWWPERSARGFGPRPRQFRTACFQQDDLPSAGRILKCLKCREFDDEEQRKPTSQSAADEYGNRIGSRAAGPELDPRCRSIAYRRPKPHFSELGARPLTRRCLGN